MCCSVDEEEEIVGGVKTSEECIKGNFRAIILPVKRGFDGKKKRKRNTKGDRRQRLNKNEGTTWLDVKEAFTKYLFKEYGRWPELILTA